MSMSNEIYVLIPAAGTGSRMGSKINKQFLEINGTPTVVRTASLFASMPEISGICIIAAAIDMSAMQELFTQYQLTIPVIFAEGGPTRQHSVLSGLRKLASALKPADDAIALVHDGARCLVTAEVVYRCIDGIRQHSVACAAAIPVKDTIKQILPDQSGELSPEVDKTLDRSLLWAIQTPQGAHYRDLLNAYETVTARNQLVTDDLAIMEAEGYSTRLTLGDYKNLKITTPEDIILAESLFANL